MYKNDFEYIKEHLVHLDRFLLILIITFYIFNQGFILLPEIV
jgi:hypothetical protein